MVGSFVDVQIEVSSSRAASISASPVAISDMRETRSAWFVIPMAKISGRVKEDETDSKDWPSAEKIWIQWRVCMAGLASSRSVGRAWVRAETFSEMARVSGCEGRVDATDETRVSRSRMEDSREALERETKGEDARETSRALQSEESSQSEVRAERRWRSGSRARAGDGGRASAAR